MITTLLSISLIIAIILLIRRPFARAYGAKAAYALWALPLIRLVLPPLPAWLSPRSLFANQTETGGTGTSAPTDTVVLETATLHAAGAAPTQLPAAVHAPTISGAQGETTETAGTLLAMLPDASQAFTALGAIAIAGAAIMLTMQAWRQWRFASLIRSDGTAPSPAVMRLAAQIQSEIGLRRAVPVRASLLSSGPLVSGFLRPVILIPAWFEADYTPAEQRVALTHEAMHVKRGDLVALQLAHIIAAVQWFNPLARRALHAFRADQEAACDADVLALRTTTPKAYGATLLKAIRQARAEPMPAFVAALPLNHAIKDRFAMLAHDTPPPKTRRTALAITLAAGTAAMLATANIGIAQEPELDGASDTDTRVVLDGNVHTHIITRRTGETSQMVILTDPMADLEEILVEVDRLDVPEPPTPPTPPEVFPPAPPALDHSILQTLEGLEDLTALEGLGDIVTFMDDGGTLVISIDTTEMAALEATIEAEAARFEEEIERWSQQLEARLEGDFAQEINAFEESMRAFEAQIEALTESPEFDAAVARGSASIEALNEKCRDVDFDTVDLAVVESPQGDKAICVDPDANADAINAAVMADPALSDAEKRRFLDRADEHIHVEVHRD